MVTLTKAAREFGFWILPFNLVDLIPVLLTVIGFLEPTSDVVGALVLFGLFFFFSFCFFFF
jgi:hypothetical protein